MAKPKNGTERSGNPNPAVKHRFINYDLDAEQKATLRKLDISVEFPITTIYDLVSTDYKFSLVRDEKNDSFIATLTDKSGYSDYANCSLSGRGNSIENAIAALLFRHVYIADGLWSKLEVPGSQGADDFG